MVEQSTLTQRIFQRAEEMALTQDLSRLAGISDARLNSIRSGEPLSSTEFELICRALAVDSGAMYSGQAASPSMRARAFAPAFLAPRSSVLEWHRDLPTRLKKNPTTIVNALAETWGLSFEGAAWHAKNCDLIEPAEADRLAGMPKKPQISLADFETQIDFYQPDMLNKELPKEPAPLWQGWASLLVIEAFDDGHISVGRARELLTWG